MSTAEERATTAQQIAAVRLAADTAASLLTSTQVVRMALERASGAVNTDALEKALASLDTVDGFIVSAFVPQAKS